MSDAPRLHGVTRAGDGAHLGAADPRGRGRVVTEKVVRISDKKRRPVEFTPERIAEIRAEVQRRLAAKVEENWRRTPRGPAPRYDDVFWEGLRWLNSL